jgi:hypothetical protein
MKQKKSHTYCIYVRVLLENNKYGNSNKHWSLYNMYSDLFVCNLEERCKRIKHVSFKNVFLNKILIKK